MKKYYLRKDVGNAKGIALGKVQNNIAACKAARERQCLI